MRPGRVSAVAVAALVAGCATLTGRHRALVPGGCEFTVANQTPHVLEIRMGVRAASTVTIGTLNPGELMTHTAPCAQRRAWIGGVAIPEQTGAATRFGVVQGWAELVEGDRAWVPLHWP